MLYGLTSRRYGSGASTVDDELSELARKSPKFGRLHRISPLGLLRGRYLPE